MGIEIQITYALLGIGIGITAIIITGMLVYCDDRKE